MQKCDAIRTIGTLHEFIAISSSCSLAFSAGLPRLLGLGEAMNSLYTQNKVFSNLFRKVLKKH